MSFDKLSAAETENTRGLACAPEGGTKWRRLMGFAWPFFAIPAVLTGLFSVFSGVPSPAHLGLYYFVNFVITLAIGGIITLNYSVLFPRLFQRSRRTAWQIGLHVVAVTSGVFIGVEIALRVLSLFPGFTLNTQRPHLYQVGLVVATVIVAIAIAFERLRAYARNVELREERARREALRAQLQALQARTNPHFLFNSLNAVAGLIEEDPKRAEKAVELLSAVFRYSLEGARRTHVPLAAEIEAVKGYLEVESIRFGKRLRSKVEIAPGTEALNVPPLVLQPLVENAVQHGVAPLREGGRVDVRVQRKNGSLVLTVEDNGPGPGKSLHQGSRTAVAELKERLHLLYGSDAHLDVQQRAGGGTRVRVQIPLQSSNGESA